MSCNHHVRALFLFPFMGPLLEPRTHFSTSLLFFLSPSRPSLFSTLFSPSPSAFSSCYLSKSVLPFQIHQMFSIQQCSRSGAVGCRTSKLLISLLVSVLNLRASAMNNRGASCKYYSWSKDLFRNQIKNEQRLDLYNVSNRYLK